MKTKITFVTEDLNIDHNTHDGVSVAQTIKELVETGALDVSVSNGFTIEEINCRDTYHYLFNINEQEATIDKQTASVTADQVIMPMSVASVLSIS